MALLCSWLACAAHPAKGNEKRFRVPWPNVPPTPSRRLAPVRLDLLSPCRWGGTADHHVDGEVVIRRVRRRIAASPFTWWLVSAVTKTINNAKSLSWRLVFWHPRKLAWQLGQSWLLKVCSWRPAGSSSRGTDYSSTCKHVCGLACCRLLLDLACCGLLLATSFRHLFEPNKMQQQHLTSTCTWECGGPSGP